jgi:hypothetical protein
MQADIRAFNNSQSMPRFSDDISCIRAQKRLLCALLFPKCNSTAGTGAVVSQVNKRKDGGLSVCVIG